MGSPPIKIAIPVGLGRFSRDAKISTVLGDLLKQMGLNVAKVAVTGPDLYGHTFAKTGNHSGIFKALLVERTVDFVAPFLTPYPDRLNYVNLRWGAVPYAYDYDGFIFQNSAYLASVKFHWWRALHKLQWSFIMLAILTQILLHRPQQTFTRVFKRLPYPSLNGAKAVQLVTVFHMWSYLGFAIASMHLAAVLLHYRVVTPTAPFSSYDDAAQLLGLGRYNLLVPANRNSSYLFTKFSSATANAYSTKIWSDRKVLTDDDRSYLAPIEEDRTLVYFTQNYGSAVSKIAHFSKRRNLIANHIPGSNLLPQLAGYRQDVPHHTVQILETALMNLQSFGLPHIFEFVFAHSHPVNLFRTNIIETSRVPLTLTDFKECFYGLGAALGVTGIYFYFIELRTISTMEWTVPQSTE